MEFFFTAKCEDVKRIAETSPLGWLGQSEDVAALVGFQCIDASEWVNEQFIQVNGEFI
ncbi:unnamed protein product [Musa acuminata subsp. burmannicoides]